MKLFGPFYVPVLADGMNLSATDNLGYMRSVVVFPSFAVANKQARRV
jgi:hypothetical protein